MQRKLPASVFNLSIAFSLALLSAACGGGGGGSGGGGGGEHPAPEAAKIHYFQGDTGGDVELWRTDGTETGTYRVKDINPSESSWPFVMFTTGKHTYFLANDGVHGNDLWVTDGTEAGTHLVADTYPGEDLWLCSFTAFKGKVYFTPCMTPDGETGGLWETDGTAEGTRRTTDLFDLAGELAVLGDLLMISGKSSTAAQSELWAYDGSNPPWPIRGPSGESYLTPGSFLISGNSLYFSAFTPEAGMELRGFDAEDVTTWDVCGGTCGWARPLRAHGGKIYFESDLDGGNGGELWILDPIMGTTTRLHEFVTNSTANLFPQGTVGDRLVFLAHEAGATQLWSTNGTPAGTAAISAVSGGFGQWLSGGMVDGAIVTVIQGESDVEVWRSDGSASGTTKMASVGEYSCINPEGGFAGDGVYFVLQQPEDTKSHLWRTDGTELGTHRIDAAQLSTCNL